MFRKVKVPRLEGEQIFLRGWNRKDAEDLYAYAKDPVVGPRAGWAPHKSVRDSRLIIEDVYLEKVVWAIIDRESGKAIGNIGFDEDLLRRKVNSRELGYSLSRSFWGRGIVPEAARLVIDHGFRTLGIDCITMRIEEDNEASRRVAEKCGFTFEGILRYSYKRFDQRIANMACYSLLAAEYLGGEDR